MDAITEQETDMKSASKLVAGMLAAIAGLTAAQSSAATFAAWEVANVPFGDTLTVRKYPSNNSQKTSAYPNGAVLQMTGRCTGGLNLKNIGHLPIKKQKQLVRYKWCEIWHDSKRNGDFATGWVYGKYIMPY